MRDSEFIELLNLYLDHEISAADAARLEAEVQSNPSRRRVYQDYCRMQKGCKMLAQDFASEPAADRKIVAFEDRETVQSGRRQLGYVAAGLFAAAACVAFLVVGRTHLSPTTTTPAVAVQDAPKAPASAVVAAAPVPASENKTALNELSVRNRERGGLVIAPKQVDPHLAWIENVQLTPVQLPGPGGALRLENDSGSRTDERTYTSGNKPLPPDVQPIAIRFQR